MPLPKPAPRKMHHLRDIALRGYEREDGLVDVDVHLTDTKTYTGFNYETGPVPAGTPVHDMWLRLTVDMNMTIIDCVAAMDTTPHMICGGAAPNYSSLIGLNIAKGFLKAAAERVGGTMGCTHLREILQQVATTAFQTMVSVRGQDREAYKPANANALAGMLNTCHAFDEKGPVIAGFRERLGIA
jgi:hypothetical protein